RTRLSVCGGVFFFFFFQAEDGIRDFHVTGVQTCALPILSFGGDIGYQGFGQGIPGSNDFKWFPTSGLGLNLSIPIFNGGSTKAKINQATIQIKQLEVDMEDTRLWLNLANENAKAQIKTSMITVDANTRNVQLSKEVLEDTQNNYRNGLATLTELLDAENALATAEN